ncbi:phage tail protein [cf. Phormidesmis sp. LEGE 11477]|uniref:phage tail protein n=1 Tax=cf. Phormidesmis sp. LEGE 11477 TaxID=1828680 RepID=UPI001880D1D3|nr:phage tail protein [cf. Phormidesmis sp. LEGE 11477]MBE9062417.1 phage tail protein [cf. Phormidesmis sp. LEGE 11477]
MSDYEVLTTARFYLELKLQGSDDRIDGYFMECRGFAREQDVIEHCEVVPQKWGKSAEKGRVVRTKMPGNSKSSNITLRMGMTISPTTWKWFKSVEEGEWSKQLRDGSLTVYQQDGEMAARFDFIGAWPVKYKIGDVKADSSDFQIEEVELAVDEFKRVEPTGQDY